jgi:hypothetical protein
MSKINSRNWAAYENRQPPFDPSAVQFYVIGQVETTNSAKKPILRRAIPQGFNPKILILNLTIEDSGGIGTTDINYRDTRFDDQIGEGQYSDVQIMYESELQAATPVQVVS